MSIVGPEFERLKRFNLAELRDAFSEKDKGSGTTEKSLEEPSSKSTGSEE
jgi:hypothetical protein